MNKIIFSTLVLLACATSLTAQITYEQANAIVFQHIQNEVNTPYKLYVYNHAPSANDIVLTTHNDEKIKVKHRS
jgi:type III secretory pathway lipoprotein EscJ